jgi:hypothetical protein
MDTTVVSLILSQILTLILLFISEFLALSSSPYSGIVHAFLDSMEKKIRQDICLNDS